MVESMFDMKKKINVFIVPNVIMHF